MGQMQRRKRKFREKMRKDGECVPSLRVAKRRAWWANVKAGAQLVSACMTALGIRRQARVQGEPVFMAPATLDDPSMPDFLAAMSRLGVTVYVQDGEIKAHASA